MFIRECLRSNWEVKALCKKMVLIWVNCLEDILINHFLLSVLLVVLCVTLFLLISSSNHLRCPMIWEVSWNIASLNIFVHDVINLLYYEHWADKPKYFQVYIFSLTEKSVLMFNKRRTILTVFTCFFENFHK